MQKNAGLLFFLSGAVIILGILTAEIFYPNYNISKDFISNLGSTPPPNSIIKEPSAKIFDFSMILAGILTIVASYSLFQFSPNRLVPIFFAIAGVGTAGVGIFPAFTGAPHIASALTAFLFSGISAILTYKITNPPFAYLTVLFGTLTLIFLILGVGFSKEIVPILGTGGTERWIAYPSIILFIGLGGYLMGTETKNKK
jgi:hypothetical membrane protein